jgi:hypothetical protein
MNYKTIEYFRIKKIVTDTNLECVCKSFIEDYNTVDDKDALIAMYVYLSIEYNKTDVFFYLMTFKKLNFEDFSKAILRANVLLDDTHEHHYETILKRYEKLNLL